MMNLDYEAANTARAIIEPARAIIEQGGGPVHTKALKSKLENVIFKSLGILQEQGIYASSLYLWTRGKSETQFAAIVREELLRLSIRLLNLPSHTTAVDAATYLAFVSEKLNHDFTVMLWMKDAWELALVYARYGAKTVHPTHT